MSINHINPDVIKDYDGPITIEGVDDGCNSAGGLYRKNNPFYNSFESVVKTVKKKDFKNDIYVYQQGHQTYGFFDDEGKRKHTIGVVNLRSTIDSKGLSSGVAVSLGECLFMPSLCAVYLQNQMVMNHTMVNLLPVEILKTLPTMYVQQLVRFLRHLRVIILVYTCWTNKELHQL